MSDQSRPNLLHDPGERWNLWETTMDMDWVLRPVNEQIALFKKSVAKYRNVTTSEEFTGYSLNSEGDKA